MIAMSKRVMAALCLALALNGPICAQTPAEEETASPRCLPDEQQTSKQADSEQPASEKQKTEKEEPAPQPEPAAEEPAKQPRTVGDAAVGVPVTSFQLVDCDVCAPAPCGPRFWFTAEGVLGWMQRSPLPPLVTTSPAGTPQTTAGVLGQNTTSILFGSQSVNGDVRGGFKLGAGYWFDDEQCLGVEIGVMALESQATPFATFSSVHPILARPYLDATTGNQQAVLIGFPGASTGTIDVLARSGNFIESHLDIYGNIVNESCFRLDCLIGYRFYRYDDGIRIHQNIAPTGPNFVDGTQIDTFDDFATENTFHGGEIGLRGEFRWDKFSLGLLAKVAAGSVHRDVVINGGQVVSVPGSTPSINNAGVYALSSNIGRFGSDDWTYLPEIGATLGWQASSHLRLTMGYSLMLLNDIARAADQIDQTINPNLFPPPQTPTTPSRPAFSLDRENVWLQSFNFGVEIRF
jgi:hypothetical protein